MNNTNLEAEPEVLNSIAERYARRVRARPFFCDLLYWMGRDAKASAEIAKSRAETLATARRTLADHMRTRRVTSLNVLDVELKSLWSAMVNAHITQKECSETDGDAAETRARKEAAAEEGWNRVADAAYDCITDLMRIIDVVRNRAAIG